MRQVGKFNLFYAVKRNSLSLKLHDFGLSTVVVKKLHQERETRRRLQKLLSSRYELAPKVWMEFERTSAAPIQCYLKTFNSI